MPATLQEALPFILLALALLVALWVIIRASRTTKVIGEQKGDVLDEGAGPAARNQALIDAAPSTTDDTGVPLRATDKQQEASAQPITQPAPSPSPTVTSGPQDDLKRIKGVGPKLVTLLAQQGITRFDQIAGWSEADIEKVDASLGRFAGRIARDKWVEQAKLLATGDDSGFSKTFGNNS